MVSMATDAPDLLDLLTADHREVRSAFAELDGRLPEARRRTLVERTVTALVQHSVVEEQLLYPLARRVLPDGGQHADHDVAEHAEVERLMLQLERLDVDSEAFATTRRQWVRSTVAHIEEEEADLFPRLREACTADELVRLGRQAVQLRKVAPTRPHPATPNHPVAHLTVGPVVGLFDRVRDRVSGRGRD